MFLSFQETYDRIRTLTYCDADLFILCFSLVEPSSFENLSSRWLTELKHYRPQTPFMVVGTHFDIREKILHEESDRATRAGSRKERTFITYRKAAKWAKKNNAVCYVECSSLSGEGVDDVFQMALGHVVAPKKKNNFHKSFRRFFWKVWVEMSECVWDVYVIWFIGMSVHFLLVTIRRLIEESIFRIRAIKNKQRIKITKTGFTRFKDGVLVTINRYKDWIIHRFLPLGVDGYIDICNGELVSYTYWHRIFLIGQWSSSLFINLLFLFLMGAIYRSYRLIW